MSKIHDYKVLQEYSGKPERKISGGGHKLMHDYYNEIYLQEWTG